jgi:hypothetical protein
METRRFPPPWSAEETEACFIVRDANGQALGTAIDGAPPHPRRGPAHRRQRAKLFREEPEEICTSGSVSPSCWS